MQIILYSEVNILCILILLLLISKIRKSMFLQSQRFLFILVAASNAVFYSLDLIWILNEGNFLFLSKTANWIVNILYYIFAVAVSFLWFLYSENLMGSQFLRKRSCCFISAVPALFIVVLSILSYWTSWIFYLDDTGIYHRGSLHFLQVTTTYAYIIFTAAKALILSFQTENYRQKKSYRTLAGFIIPSIIAGTVQTLVQGVPTLCVGTTLGILYVYINLQEQLISVDALTGLNNRNQLRQYMYNKLHHQNSDKLLYLLIMDIDSFKKINDRYGHVEGDRALQLVSQGLMNVCRGRNFFISRYGGDEFIVICELEHDESVDKVCEGIHEELKRADTTYPLTISIGYAKYDTTIKNDQEFIARADIELYHNKQEKKQKTVTGC